MNRKLKNILIALVAGFFALARAVEVVEPVDPLAHEHEIDPRYDEGYDETSSGRPTPEPGAIDPVDRRDSGISMGGDTALISPDTSSQMPIISDATGSLPQTDLPTVTTTVQQTFDEPTNNPTPVVTDTFVDLVQKPGSAQAALDHIATLVDQVNMAPKDKAALKRDLVADLALRVLTDTTGLLFGNRPGQKINLAVEDLIALQSSELLTQGERDFMIELRRQLEEKVEGDVVQLAILKNAKEAISRGDLSVEDGEAIIDQIFSQGALPDGAAQIIGEIRRLPIDVYQGVKDNAESSARVARVVVDNFSKEAQQLQSSIEASLDHYTPDQDMLIAQKFSELAKNVAGAQKYVQGAVDRNVLLAQLFTQDATVAFAGKNIADLMSVENLSDPVKTQIIDALLLQSSASGGAFAQEVKGVQRTIALDGLLQRVSKDPQSVALLRAFASDPVQYSLTPKQKIQLADTWLQPLKGLSLDQLSRNDLQVIAKSQELNAEALDPKRQAWRDLGQEFSDDNLFGRFLKNYILNDPVKITDVQRTDLHKVFMDGVVDESGPLYLNNSLSEHVQSIEQLYKEWQQKKQSEIQIPPVPGNTAVEGVAYIEQRVSTLTDPSLSEQDVARLKTEIGAQIKEIRAMYKLTPEQDNNLMSLEYKVSVKTS